MEYKRKCSIVRCPNCSVKSLVWRHWALEDEASGLAKLECLECGMFFDVPEREFEAGIVKSY